MFTGSSVNEKAKTKWLGISCLPVVSMLYDLKALSIVEVHSAALASFQALHSNTKPKI